MISSKIFEYIITISCCLIISSASSDFEDIKFNPVSLVDQTYQGTYYSNQEEKLFDYLDVEEGVSKLHFVYDDLVDKTGLNAVYITLFNPKYHDLKAVVFEFQLPDYNANNNTWKNETAHIIIYRYNQQAAIQNYQCVASIEIMIENATQTITDYSFHLTVQSLDGSNEKCKINFDAEVSYYFKQKQVFFYCLFLSVFILIEIFCDARIFRQINLQTLDAKKLSIATVTFCCIQDLYTLLTFVMHLMSDSKFYMFYIAPVILQVLLIIVFDLRLAMFIWKNRSNPASQSLRKKMLTLYIFFYLFVLLYSTMMFLFPYKVPLIIIQSLYFLPQIYHNYRNGSNPQLYLYYILGFLTIRRISLPLYERAYPQNLFMLHPSYIFCAFWILSYIIQISILILQKRFGPKFFIPKRFLPGYYNYKFKYTLHQSNDQQCSICLGSLYNDVTKINDSIINTNNQSLIKQALVVKTPCNHMFHESCFQSWFEIKSQCPICRLQLPPYLN